MQTMLPMRSQRQHHIGGSRMVRLHMQQLKVPLNYLQNDQYFQQDGYLGKKRKG